MKAPSIARILGIVLLLAGLAGFVPFTTVPATGSDEFIQLSSGYGFVAGLFAVNTLHNGIHLVLGIWGIGASFSFAGAVRYCRWLAPIFGLLAILGLIPITDTLFGIVPLYGNDVWLHALIALAALYGGYGPARIPPMEEAALPPAST